MTQEQRSKLLHILSVIDHNATNKWMNDLTKCSDMIEELFKHGVCIDCVNYGYCSLTEMAYDDFDPETEYCSGFEPKEPK